MAEQFENECLIADHGADPVDTVASALDAVSESLCEWTQRSVNSMWIS